MNTLLIQNSSKGQHEVWFGSQSVCLFQLTLILLKDHTVINKRLLLLKVLYCSDEHWRLTVDKKKLNFIHVLIQRFAGRLHWTKTEISYMSRLPTHDISYTYLVEDRAEFHVTNEMCRKSGMSYTEFPSCTKFKFLSSVEGLKQSWKLLMHTALTTTLYSIVV